MKQRHQTANVQLVNELAMHLGADHGISADHLAVRLGVTTRHLRRMVSEARDCGVAVCGTPGTGYYMPSTATELDDACAFLRRRAMHSLRLLRVMRRTAMPTLSGQLLLAKG